MNDMAMQAISMMQAQSPNTLISLKQQVKSDEAMVNMLSESQRNLASVTETRGQNLNISV